MLRHKELVIYTGQS